MDNDVLGNAYIKKNIDTIVHEKPTGFDPQEIIMKRPSHIKHKKIPPHWIGLEKLSEFDIPNHKKNIPQKVHLDGNNFHEEPFINHAVKTDFYYSDNDYFGVPNDISYTFPSYPNLTAKTIIDYKLEESLSLIKNLNNPLPEPIPAQPQPQPQPQAQQAPQTPFEIAQTRAAVRAARAQARAQTRAQEPQMNQPVETPITRPRTVAIIQPARERFRPPPPPQQTPSPPQQPPQTNHIILPEPIQFQPQPTPEYSPNYTFTTPSSQKKEPRYVSLPVKPAFENDKKVVKKNSSGLKIIHTKPKSSSSSSSSKKSSNIMQIDEIYTSNEPEYSGVNRVDYIPPQTIVKDDDFHPFLKKTVETKYDNEVDIGKKRKSADKNKVSEKKLTLSTDAIETKVRRQKLAEDTEKMKFENKQLKKALKEFNNLKNSHIQENLTMMERIFDSHSKKPPHRR